MDQLRDTGDTAAPHMDQHGDTGSNINRYSSTTHWYEINKFFCFKSLLYCTVFIEKK
jgi:hypothetical protein